MAKQAVDHLFARQKARFAVDARKIGNHLRLEFPDGEKFWQDREPAKRPGRQRKTASGHRGFGGGAEAGGGTVTLFDCWDRSAYADFAAMNMALVRSVAQVKPDVIFLVLMGPEVWTETLDLIRSYSPAAVVNWGTDDSWKYAQFSRFIAPHVDLHVTTHAPTVERGARDGP